MTRLFVDQPLASGHRLNLPEPAFRHAVQVLRLREGETLQLFNGDGHDYDAVLTRVAKREAEVAIGERRAVDRESALRITLAQGISKGERMDWAIQKAVELGAGAIAPIITERCNVKLDAERWEKKREHWRGVIIAACEQSGRAVLPALAPICTLDAWLAQDFDGLGLTLDPRSERGLGSLPRPQGELRLLIGPEGGLSEAEIDHATRAGYLGLRLGPRVLRTETAAIAAIAALQTRFGDLDGA